MSGHRSRVLDIQWNPFDENLIASASEDCTVKVGSLRSGSICERTIEFEIRFDREGVNKDISVREENLRGCPTQSPLFTNIFADWGQKFARMELMFENFSKVGGDAPPPSPRALMSNGLISFWKFLKL